MNFIQNFLCAVLCTYKLNLEHFLTETSFIHLISSKMCLTVLVLIPGLIMGMKHCINNERRKRIFAFGISVTDYTLIGRFIAMQITSQTISDDMFKATSLICPIFMQSLIVKLLYNYNSIISTRTWVQITN